MLEDTQIQSKRGDVVNMNNHEAVTTHTFDAEYHNLLQKVLSTGEERIDRTGVGTIGMFGQGMMSFDLENGTIPLLTTKRVYWKGVVEELLWFMRGQTNSKILERRGVNIWKDNTTEEFQRKCGLSYLDEGEIGEGYGFQWRNWNGDWNEWIAKGKRTGYDQLKKLVSDIKHTPHSRRLILSSWNASSVDRAVLPPCHMFAQFHVSNDDKLSCIMYQRSCDMFLGVPFNIASYSLLLAILAQITGKRRGTFQWIGGDIHVYKNHIEQCELQLSRQPFAPPLLHIHPDVTDLDGVDTHHIILENYHCHPPIKAPFAV